MILLFWNVWNVPRSWNVGHTSWGHTTWGILARGKGLGDYRNLEGLECSYSIWNVRTEAWNVWNVLIVGNVLIVFNKTKKIPERAVQVCVRPFGTVL